MRRSIRAIASTAALAHAKHIPAIVCTLKNWIPFLSDYIGITDKPRTYLLRNGLKIRTGDGMSSATVAVVLIKQDYGPPPGPNSVVIDIGANIGVYTLYAAQSTDTIVYAYEPMPDNYALLEENVRLNNLQTRVFPFQLALSGKKEKRGLYLGASPLHSFLPMAESPFHGKFSDPERQDWIDVRCIALQDVFDDNRIEKCDLLKMDCEGAEYDILYNLPDPYFRRIRSIRLEYHHHLDNERNTGEALIEFLRGNGFQTKKIKRASEYQGDVWMERS